MRMRERKRTKKDIRARVQRARDIQMKPRERRRTPVDFHVAAYTIARPRREERVLFHARADLAKRRSLSLFRLIYARRAAAHLSLSGSGNFYDCKLAGLARRRLDLLIGTKN